ncbi:MAG TPA: MarR family transcriptional regulator [Candidatus Eisenbacteria bacterium]|nr:MarR family transcriptional regulator [Candidatus Eisenbacteria bacterium]
MDLTNQLTDALFTFFRLMKQNLGIKSDLANLSMVQLQTLFYLKKNNPSPMRKIAEYVQVELPSATNLIDTLVSLDLVMRNADNQDKRVVNVSLTPKAQNLLDKVKKERTENMNVMLMPLSNTDKKQFLEILQKLNQSVGDNT